MGILDERLADSAFIASDRFTLADIDAFVCVDFAGWVKIPVLDDCPNIRSWYERVSKRPAAKI